jgi:sulfatase modifying factor 1
MVSRDTHTHRHCIAAIVWAGVLATALLIALLFSRSMERQLNPTEAEIESLRRLAALDIPRFTEAMDHLMVDVPAGEFLMGSDSGRSDERPLHQVYLDSFELDRYEITNAQYQHFLQAAGRQSPPYWQGIAFPIGQADYPVVGASWDEADAYCAWRGKRLPTEAEWEKACRGDDGRLYPWGDVWDAGRANVDVSVPASQADPSIWEATWQLLRVTPVNPAGPGLRPIGSTPNGASPYGVMDMVGNAAEWVADWYNWSDYSDLPSRNPRGMGPPWNHSLRGSAWRDPTGNASWTRSMSRCSARNSSHETQDPRVGFRCARSLP